MKLLTAGLIILGQIRREREREVSVVIGEHLISNLVHLRSTVVRAVYVKVLHHSYVTSATELTSP